MIKILIIDDDPMIRLITSQYFESLGHEVTDANNGKDGIELFQKGKFDIVITDLMMSKMHGFEVIDMIRSLPGGNDIPIILLTADKDEPELQHYIRKGIQDDTLVKPFDVPVLERMIDSLIRNSPDS